MTRSRSEWTSHLARHPEEARELRARVEERLLGGRVALFALFGEDLDPTHLQQLLSGRDGIRPDEPEPLRELRAELLAYLLRPLVPSPGPVPEDELLLEAARALATGDAAKAEDVAERLVRRSRPKAAPPVFTSLPTRAEATNGPTPPRFTIPTHSGSEVDGAVDANAIADAKVASDLIASTGSSKAADELVHEDPTANVEVLAHDNGIVNPDEVEDDEVRDDDITAPAPSTGAHVPHLTRVSWEIGVPMETRVRVTLHDGTGEMLRELFDGVLAAGVHECDAQVPADALSRIGSLGYLRMELPGGRWQQSIYVPPDEALGADGPASVDAPAEADERA